MVNCPAQGSSQDICYLVARSVLPFWIAQRAQEVVGERLDSEISM